MHLLHSSVAKRHSTKLSIFLDSTGLICLCEEYSFGVFVFLSNIYSMMLDMCALSVGCGTIGIKLFTDEVGFVRVKGNLICC